MMLSLASLHDSSKFEDSRSVNYGGTLVEIAVVYVGQAGRENFEHGVATSTWGFSHDRAQYHQLTSGMPFLLGTDYSHPTAGASPRKHSAEYAVGSIGTVALCEVSGSLTTATSLHWPNEIDTATLIYPYRVGLTPMATATDVQLSSLSLELSDAFRLSANYQSGAIVLDIPEPDLELLAANAGIQSWASGKVTYGEAPGVSLPPASTTGGKKNGSRTQGRGPGRMQDAEARVAIELRAVDMAIEHYKGQGWDVTVLGKPYDLDCTKDGSSLRVEVKGTTGSGAQVELTVNEVKSAGKYPTELVVVRDILLDRTGPVPTASGGVMKVFPNWTPSIDDLRVSRYEYNVPW